jgi:hypothetical protein
VTAVIASKTSATLQFLFHYFVFVVYNGIDGLEPKQLIKLKSGRAFSGAVNVFYTSVFENIKDHVGYFDSVQKIVTRTKIKIIASKYPD